MQRNFKLREVAAFASLGISAARFAGFWGDEVLLNGGGTQSLHSTPLEREHINGTNFLKLPDAEYILVALITPPRCLTCSGFLMEFERIVKGLESLCANADRGPAPAADDWLPAVANSRRLRDGGSIKKVGSPRPFLCAVSIDCSHFGAMCEHYGRGHLEPFGSVLLDEPNVQPEPPEGWLYAWPTSSLLLARRDHLMGDLWVPMYWRLDNYDSAAQILGWLRTKLGGLPAAARITEQASLLSAKPLSRHGDWEIKAMESIGPIGHLTEHHCLCQNSWTTCTGGFLGMFKSCRKAENCDKKEQWCPTLALCRGITWDSCKPELTFRTAVAFPRTSSSSIDSELAASLWLHMIWETAEFPVSGVSGTKLSARGAARRRALLDFLRVLCASFPPDSQESTEETENVMLGANAIIQNEAKMSASLNGADVRARRLHLQPTSRCRSSFCKLYSLLRHKWKLFTSLVPGRRTARVSAARLERHWHFCGHSWAVWSTKKWHECRGSFSGTRQLPCGIWTMLHAVLAHADDAAGKAVFEEEAAQVSAKARHQPRPSQLISPRRLVRSIRQFITEFMDCRACVINFLAAPYDEDRIQSHRDAVIWLWRAHNYVSGIVKDTPTAERAFAEDPAFPTKHYWPPKHICHECWKFATTVQEQAVEEAAAHLVKKRATQYWNPAFDEASCEDVSGIHSRECPREAGEWNFDAIFTFLSKFYGSGLALDSPGWSGPRPSNVSSNVEMVDVDGPPLAGGHSTAWPLWSLGPWSVVAWAVYLLAGSLAVRHFFKQRPTHACQTVSTDVPVLHRARDALARIAEGPAAASTDEEAGETVRLMAGDPSSDDE